MVKKVSSVLQPITLLFEPLSRSDLARLPSNEVTLNVLWKPSPEALLGTTPYVR